MSSPGPLTWFFLFSIAAAVVHYLFRPIVLVAQGEAVVVERLGVFSRELRTGWHFIWPLLERARPVEWRYSVEERTAIGAPSVRTDYFRNWRIPVSECVHVVPPSSFSLSDGRTLCTGVTLDYEIVDVRRAVYVQDLFLRLEGKLRSELQSAARSLDEKMDAPALEQALRSRLGTLKWAEQNGLRLSGCTLNGFTLSAASSPQSVAQPRGGRPTQTLPSDSEFGAELALMQYEHKYEAAMLEQELKVQSLRASAHHAAMAAELLLLENASKGGVANDVLVAYLRLRSGVTAVVKPNDAQ
jgi:regulator of protease activity HflC (stomatin/prohibitin superfamily)